MIEIDPLRRRRLPNGLSDEWLIREIDCRNLPGAKAPQCLICECAAVVRRVWAYPANWYDLPDETLRLLCASDAMASGNLT